MGSNILLENDTVEEVVIPDTVKIIKPQAFFGCDSLESINISDTCKSIGSAAFFRCSSLEEIHRPV